MLPSKCLLFLWLMQCTHLANGKYSALDDTSSKASAVRTGNTSQLRSTPNAATISPSPSKATNQTGNSSPQPSQKPTKSPAPSLSLSQALSNTPTSTPGPSITPEPTFPDTLFPSAIPTESPSSSSSPSPSDAPTDFSFIPLDFSSFRKNTSSMSSIVPSESPSAHSFVGLQPSKIAPENSTEEVLTNGSPSTSKNPSPVPTKGPSFYPISSRKPSLELDTSPSVQPTKFSSRSPDATPATTPTRASNTAELSSLIPTIQEDLSEEQLQNRSDTFSPSVKPSEEPAKKPSRGPTVSRTSQPTSAASITPNAPSIHPSKASSGEPTNYFDASTTESQASSIYPTNMPLKTPTVVTDHLQSNQPTKSDKSISSLSPSFIPTKSIIISSIPSDQPVASPPFESDKGNRQLMAHVNVTISDVEGTMENKTVSLFEETVLSLLIDRYPQLQSFDITFWKITVEGQVFRYDNRRLDEEKRIGDLIVHFLVEATIQPEIPEGFEFQLSMGSFFVAHENQLMSRLKTLELAFESNRIEGSQTEQTLSNVDESEQSLADFFTTTVIASISAAIAAVLLIGAFVMSRMWRSQEVYHVDSPGRLGAFPSYDSEDQILGRHSSSDEPSMNDPQSVFFSFSQLSRLDQKSTLNRSTLGDTGPKSIGSCNNSSANGSYLAGLDIFSSSSAESRNGTRSNLLSLKSTSGVSGKNLHLDECEAIRTRTKNILDDLESHSRDSSEDFVEVQLNVSSTNSLSMSLEPTSSGESFARQKKRTLEKKLQEIKQKATCQTMQTLMENEELKAGSRMACLTMKDFIAPSLSLVDEFEKHGLHGYPSRSYSSQFLSINTSHSHKSSPARSMPKMSTTELFQLAQHVPVDGTPQNATKKVYNRMSDVSGTIVEEPNVETAPSHETETGKSSSDSSAGKIEEVKPSGWFRKVLTHDRHHPTEKSAEKSNTSRGRRLRLFGRNKHENAWDQTADTNHLSPRKRYRRGGRGQLVPRRFARGGPNDDADEDSQIESTDEEDNDQSEKILLGGGDKNRDENLGNSRGAGIIGLKQRPPMLDLEDLDGSDDTENDEDVECPLMTHPLPSRNQEGMQMTYGRDMLYGQDPDGFELTTHNRRQRTVQVPSDLYQSSSQYDDPPTASEHRRSVFARKQAKKSALRKKDSPRRTEAERVTFYDQSMEFPVNEDAVILGSTDTNDSQLELEWGNMI